MQPVGIGHWEFQPNDASRSAQELAHKAFGRQTVFQFNSRDIARPIPHHIWAARELNHECITADDLVDDCTETMELVWVTGALATNNQPTMTFAAQNLLDRIKQIPEASTRSVVSTGRIGNVFSDEDPESDRVHRPRPDWLHRQYTLPDDLHRRQ